MRAQLQSCGLCCSSLRPMSSEPTHPRPPHTDPVSPGPAWGSGGDGPVPTAWVAATSLCLVTFACGCHSPRTRAVGLLGFCPVSAMG